MFATSQINSEAHATRRRKKPAFFIKPFVQTSSMPSPSLWTLDSKEAAMQLGCDLNSGLSTKDAEERLKKHGENRLKEEEQLSFWKIAAHEVTEPMILLLLGVGVIYSFWGKLEDTIAILVIITILVFVEVFTEFRAKGAIAALRKLVSPTAPVIRDGKYAEVLTTGVVPGDLVLLRVGERVPADLRLVESFGLASDESQLTGESVPVDKDASAILDEASPLQERKNMVFAGSVIVRGRGAGVVASTGMSTEIGKIAGMVRSAREPKTHLQLAMKEMTKWLVGVAVAFSLLVPIVGVLRGQPIKEMVLTALGLAFATIPEELPIVVTMVLALGALHLARKKALVKKLQAAETLGSVTVICADKTGTLTENRMKLSRIFFDGGFASDPKNGSERLLEAAVLSSDVVVSGDQMIGDPTQVALLKAATEIGINKVDGKLESKYGPLVNEYSFDSSRKLMSTVYSKGKSITIFSAGAPEAILERCTKVLRGERDRSLTAGETRMITEAITRMSDESLRVIAFAYKSGYSTNPANIPQKEAESGLVFLGLAGLNDPPRAEVPEAIRACRAGGIRVLMLTGDSERTAAAIARQVGIDSDGEMLTGSQIDSLSDKQLQSAVRKVSVYARVSPAHKLKIAHALKANGEIVAMTGDGVNDAPALKEADIGIAMGETGTDVAREAASMVLADDNFSTIVRAVEEGRKIFDNLRKGIGYYLSCKVALVSSAFVPAIIGLPLPFAPIQIIFLELFMDIAASTSFVVEPAEPGLMERKPRDPSAKFLDPAMQKGIFRNAAALALAVLASYFIATFVIGADPARARTIAFGTWMLGHVFLAVNMRSESEPLSKIGLFTNRLILLWGAMSILAFMAAISVPAFTSALKASTLHASDLLLILVVSAAATFWIEIGKVLGSKSAKPESRS